MRGARQEPMDLRLFDGEAGGETSAEVQTGGGASDTGNAAEASEAARRESWRGLIEGEYRDLFSEELRQAEERLRESAETAEERLAEAMPVMEAVARRYGIREGDWKALGQALEDEAVRVREKQNRYRAGAKAAARQLAVWTAEAEALREHLPDFDLARESRDSRFCAMLRARVPMELAYSALHLEELLRGAMYRAAAAAERRVVGNVRARGLRPGEAGTTAQGSFTVRENISRLSREDRADIARRAAKGERIVL